VIASSLVLSTVQSSFAQPTPAAPPSGSVEIELEDDEPAPTVTAAPTPAAPTLAAPPPAPAAPVPPAQTDALIARIEALEARSDQLQAELAEAKARDAAAEQHAVVEEKDGLGWAWDAYVQSQYESSQISENQLQSGGALINRDRFVLRRARFRLDHGWEYAALAIEVDTNTVRGLSVGLRRAQALVRYPERSQLAVPYVALTAGLQDQPFGYELPFGARKRVFAERSTASGALFPNEADVGASVSGGIGPLRYALAVLNGQPAEPYLYQDPNAAKDLIARFGADAKPLDALQVAGGVSFLRGRGFSPGSDATKGELRWLDDNQDNTVQDSELRPVGALPVERSASFDRWAVGFDALVALRTKLGVSQLYGELTLATNLDRGLFVADPVVTNGDSRELGYYAAFTQEITPYGLVGFRLDFYDGNSDFTDARRGRVVPASRSITTYSPVVGVQLPEVARLTFQYDFIDDSLARDELGVPTDLRNDQFTLRLQVGL
jgi:hypothetical protein